MNVKIQCACGTKFAFEVEPANGRMPMNVNCPGCNASALDLANAEIARQLTAAPATPAARIAVPPPTIRVAAPAAPAPPPPPQTAPPAVGVPRPSGGALRISKPASSHAPAPAVTPQASAETAQPAPASVASEAASPLCPRHKTEPALETCRVCGKPICPKCMEQFGYVCSVYCRQQAARRQIEVPVYAHQTSVVTARSSMMARRLVFASIGLVVLLTGLWIWYTWFARNP
ncbi:MAG TPA: B-box zinc finger protein, partial [Verrucomicrobiae bacterium]|nr:B-box zinc finger protein [Verrucomicrobiae bacterium]